MTDVKIIISKVIKNSILFFSLFFALMTVLSLSHLVKLKLFEDYFGFGSMSTPFIFFILFILFLSTYLIWARKKFALILFLVGVFLSVINALMFGIPFSWLCFFKIPQLRGEFACTGISVFLGTLLLISIGLVVGYKIDNKRLPVSNL